MRLRLVHTLTLLLLSAVLLAVLAMGGVMAWNLRNGFADFMESRDVEQLEQFAALVTEAAGEAGSLSALRQNTRMHDLLDRYAQQQGLVARGLPEPGGAGLRPGGPGGRPGRPGGPGGPGGYGPPPGVLPPGGADGFGARVSVVGVDGQALLAGPGRPLDVAAGPFIDRPHHAAGRGHRAGPPASRRARARRGGNALLAFAIPGHLGCGRRAAVAGRDQCALGGAALGH